jgi:alpha-beta hydrolase superfamily lysophospholipase
VLSATLPPQAAGLTVLPFTLSTGEPYPVGYLRGHLPWPTDGAPAKVLVYCAGLAGTANAVVPFLEGLQPRYHALIGVDFRSFGRHKGELPPTWQRFVPDVTEVIKALPALLADADPDTCHVASFKVDICAISLGAVVMTHVVHGLQRPNALPNNLTLGQLTLLAPAFEPHPQAFGLWFTLRHVAKWLFNPTHATMQIPYGAKELSRRIENVPNTFHQPVVLPVRLLLGTRLLSLQAVGLAKRLRCPTHVVVPLADVVCCPKAMRRFYEQLPDAIGHPHRLTELPYAYHDVLLDPADYQPILHHW